MKVKTLKAHHNGYGLKYSKAAEDEYEIPDAAARPLIAAKLVAEIPAETKKAEPKAPAKS